MNINKNKQSGLSLIELMVAMLLGVFLLAGIATSYVSSKKSSVQNDQRSLLEDNGRIALETISQVLQHAGYSSRDPNKVAFIKNTADVSSVACSDGSQSVVNTGLFNANKIVKDNPSGDSIGIIFNGDTRLIEDCVGGVLPVGCQIDQTRIYNSFFVTNKNNLKCAGSRTNKAHTIAEGVENMQFLYGVDTNIDNQVDRYLNATALSNLAVADPALWNSVISIQVAILVRSLKPVKPKSETRSYTLLDQSVTSAKDKYKREVFTTTVRLRNSL